MKRVLPRTLPAIFFVTCSSLFAQNPGELWGVTTEGGTDGLGVIYKTDPDGSNRSVQYNFSYGNPGGRPYYTALIEASSGKIYGLTTEGGTDNKGVLFEYDPATSVFTKKVDFTGTIGSQPFGSLIQASDGKLYGMTRYGGANDLGVIFQYDPATNVYTKKFDFAGTASGAEPNGSLMQLPDGKIYGMTRLGGANGAGVIFEYDITTNTFTKKHDFAGGTGGAEPLGHLTLASNNKLYGMTLMGGLSDMGTLFEFEPATSTHVVRFDFSNSVGQTPQGSLYNAANGRLYGMTYQGGANNVGVIFEYDPTTNIHTKKYDFANATGALPYGSLTQAADGKFLGLTYAGGPDFGGVLFDYDVTTNTFNPRFSFGYRTNGSNPGGTPLIASNGKIYGLTQGGGSDQTRSGVLFEFNPANNQYKNIHLKNLEHGARSAGGMIHIDGKFYGMTTMGGNETDGVGIIYEYDPVAKTITAGFNFDDVNGNSPNGNSLTLASNGKLYGTTYRGGSNTVGVLFEYDPATKAFSKKADFNSTNGRFPMGALVQHSNGKLYGTASSGGATNQGVLFEYDLDGTLTVRYDFVHATGSDPMGGLIEFSNGKLYGLAEAGGANDEGVIYEFDPSTGNYQKKYDFSGNGSYPISELTLARNQKFYGFTADGGVNDSGVLFEFDPATNAYDVKLEFGSGNDISDLIGTLALACNGKLYGAATSGGINDNGEIFEFDPTSEIYTKKQDLSEADGSYPTMGALAVWPWSVPQPVITASGINTAEPVLTSDASTGNQWYLNDVAIASGTSSTYSVSQAGVYTVQVTADHCMSSLSEPVSLVVTGLEPSLKNSINVFPNPAAGQLNIGLRGFSGNGPVSIKIMDVIGREIYNGTGAAGSDTTIDVGSFKPGAYIITMQQDHVRVSGKFIKSL